MRYPDGGGLTAAAGRARRESVRLRAARMYEHDVSPALADYTITGAMAEPTSDR
jgi:hypothetical protein